MTFHNTENYTNCAMLVSNLGERKKIPESAASCKKGDWDCWTQQEIKARLDSAKGRFSKK